MPQSRLRRAERHRLTLAAPVRTATLLKDHLDDACRQREPHQDAGRANDPLGSVLAVPGLPLSLIRGLVGQAPATGALTASRPHDDRERSDRGACPPARLQPEDMQSPFRPRQVASAPAVRNRPRQNDPRRPQTTPSLRTSARSPRSKSRARGRPHRGRDDRPARAVE